jgi:hypothetical protein
MTFLSIDEKKIDYNFSAVRNFARTSFTNFCARRFASFPFAISLASSNRPNRSRNIFLTAVTGEGLAPVAAPLFDTGRFFALADLVFFGLLLLAPRYSALACFIADFQETPGRARLICFALVVILVKALMRRFYTLKKLPIMIAITASPRVPVDYSPQIE